jgi:hypothetical protein
MAERVLYGIMAEFDEPERFLTAVRRTRAQGYVRMDAYSPNPLDELSEAMDLHDTPIPLIVLTGGIFGALTGFFLQYWAAAVDFPINVAGRPLNSWVSFIPITFECGVLGAALFSLFFGVLAMNGLPCPYHPVFNVPEFARATRDHYFVCIEAEDAMFDPAGTRGFLESLEPLEVYEVED